MAQFEYVELFYVNRSSEKYWLAQHITVDEEKRETWGTHVGNWPIEDEETAMVECQKIADSKGLSLLVNREMEDFEWQ